MIAITKKLLRGKRLLDRSHFPVFNMKRTTDWFVSFEGQSKLIISNRKWRVQRRDLAAIASIDRNQCSWRISTDIQHPESCQHPPVSQLLKALRLAHLFLSLPLDYRDVRHSGES